MQEFILTEVFPHESFVFGFEFAYQWYITRHGMHDPEWQHSDAALPKQ